MSELSIKLKSTYLNDIDEVMVVLPNPPMDQPPAEFYTPDKKFKVLWLLHGGRDTFRDWFSFSNVARIALQYGIMLVMPNGHDSDYVNHPESGDGYMFEDFFINELMPFIYNWLPASDKREDNFLAGNSMGAAASWQYGLKYPEKFACVAPLSNQPLDYSYLEEYRGMSGTEFKKFALSDDVYIRPAYGIPTDKIHVKELNSIAKYDTVGDFLDSYENTMPRFEEALSEGRLTKFWVTGGVEPRDQALLDMKADLEARGVTDVTFAIKEENTHCFAFWEKAIAEFLDFLGIPKIDYYIGV